MEFIETHPEKPWDWGYISMNQNITMEFIEKHLDKIDFQRLSLNKFVLLKIPELRKKKGFFY